MVPAGPVQERYIEHREEVGRRGADLELDRSGVLALRFGDPARLVARHLAQRPAGVVERFRVHVGQLQRGFVRLLVGLGGIPVIELNVIQDVILVGDRVVAHDVTDRDDGHAGADADRDRGHHQGAQCRVGADAQYAELQIVSKHGWLPAQAVAAALPKPIT